MKYCAIVLILDDFNMTIKSVRLVFHAENLSEAIKHAKKTVFGWVNTPNTYIPMRCIWVDYIKLAGTKYYITEYTPTPFAPHFYRIIDTPHSPHPTPQTL